MAVKNNFFHVCVVLTYCGDKNLEEVNTLLSSDLGVFEKCSVNRTESYVKSKVKPNIDDLPV